MYMCVYYLELQKFGKVYIFVAVILIQLWVVAMIDNATILKIDMSNGYSIFTPSTYI